jgi:hypothetical protein
VERADVPAERAIAVTIAEAFLDALAAGTCEELIRYLGRPTEQLIMGADQRPYLVTAIAVRRSSGSLYLHVGVTNAEWDHGVPVVRSAVVPFGRSGGS